MPNFIIPTSIFFHSLLCLYLYFSNFAPNINFNCFYSGSPWEVVSDGNKEVEFHQYSIANAQIKRLHDIPIFKTYLFHSDFDQENQTLVYTGRDYNPICFNQAYVHAIFYERVDLYIFSKAYIQGAEQLGTDGYFYDLYNFSAVYNPEDAQRRNRYRTRVGYKYVIAPIVRWLPTFGHWITDCICPLMYIEDWIWNLNPVIALSGVPQEMFQEYMKILGHENIKLVDRKYGFVYGETMFVIKGYAPEIPCGVRSLPALVEKISEFYDLKDIKPLYYGYMNKDNLNRRITNMKELISAIEDKYGVSFKELKVNRPDRKSFARSMASLKLLLCSGGSIAFNVIMMKQGTGFLTLDSECLEGPNLQIACHLKLWHIEIMHPYMRHFNHPGPGNITRALYSFKVLDYAIDHQRWPAQHNLYCPYNFTLFKTFLTGNELPQNLKVDEFNPQLFSIYLKSHENVVL